MTANKKSRLSAAFILISMVSLAGCVAPGQKPPVSSAPKPADTVKTEDGSYAAPPPVAETTPPKAESSSTSNGAAVPPPDLGGMVHDLVGNVNESQPAKASHSPVPLAPPKAPIASSYHQEAPRTVPSKATTANPDPAIAPDLLAVKPAPRQRVDRVDLGDVQPVPTKPVAKVDPVVLSTAGVNQIDLSGIKSDSDTVSLPPSRSGIGGFVPKTNH